jgi:hypothetical protein
MGYPSLMFTSKELKPAINLRDMGSSNVMNNAISPIDTSNAGLNSSAAGLIKQGRMARED